LWVAFYILRAAKGLSVELDAETFLKPLFKTYRKMLGGSNY